MCKKMCEKVLFYGLALSFYYGFNKTPLGNTGWLNKAQLLLAAQASRFLIYSLLLT